MARTSPSSFTAVHLLLLTILCCSSLLSAQSAGRDRTPPTAPTNLTVTATTEHSVSLAWGPSTDNSGRLNYVICCANGTVTVSQAVTSHTIEGLKPGTTYTLRVYAKDAAGNQSKASNAVTVTLPGQIAAPTKPVVTLLNVGPTHATLGWSSTDDGSTISVHDLHRRSASDHAEFKGQYIYVRRSDGAHGLCADQSGHDLHLHGSRARR